MQLKAMLWALFAVGHLHDTHLTHSHINATVILANIEVEIFVVDPQVATFRKFTFEPKSDAMSTAVNRTK